MHKTGRRLSAVEIAAACILAATAVGCGANSSADSPASEETSSSAIATEPAAANNPAPCSAGYVALTYDDGPTTYTPDVSQALRQSGLHATFFEMGSKVASNQSAAKAVISDGNSIGNHTNTHADLTSLTEAQYAQEISSASTAIEDATGHRPTLFRPSYGNTNAGIRKAAEALGMTEVIWTLDTNDWKGPTNAQIGAVIATAKPQDVILMHDDAQADVDIVPMIAQELAAKGLCTGQIVPSAVEVPVWDGLSYYAKVTPVLG
jgi:peptidoglycan/xylan/chitin deacetylase (PgdA/CDA1 family)